MSILSGLLAHYPLLFYLSGALQIACIIHAALRRNFYWIFILLFLSYLGVILYFFIEVLPGLRRPRVDLDPLREAFRSDSSRLNAARERLAESDTLTNRVALAALLRRAGDLEGAQAVLEPAAQGLYSDDPLLLVELADLALAQGQPQRSLELLAGIDVRRSAAVRTHVLVLRAGAHAALGQPEEAEAAYREAMTGAITEEPRLKYARFLLEQGRREEALAQLDALRRTWQRASALYRRQERPWFDQAEALRRQAEARGS